MDPITIAMSLAQFAPSIVKWMTGSDKAEAAATAVVDVAKQVTGCDTGEAALTKLQGSPELQAQYRTRMAEMDADLDKAFLADRQDARKRDVAFVEHGTHNYRADVMVALAFLAVVAIATLMALGKIDASTGVGGFMITIGGMFARNIGTAFDFEFGSSRGSQNKDAGLIARITGRE